jgi:hypothetical protein
MLEQWAAEGGRKAAAPETAKIEKIFAQALAIATLAAAASD